MAVSYAKMGLPQMRQSKLLSLKWLKKKKEADKKKG